MWNSPDDPRNHQPSVPSLEKCEVCGLMFPEDTMITDKEENVLYCSVECRLTYWTKDMKKK